jgi:alkyl hydroperoxide reductase subunit AhpC
MSPLPRIVQEAILAAYAPGGAYSRSTRATRERKNATLSRFRQTGTYRATDHVEAEQMPLRIGDEAPDFTAETTEERSSSMSGSGMDGRSCSQHPKDFTPRLHDELGYMAKLKPEFEKRNTKGHGSVDRPGQRSQAMGRRHRGDPGSTKSNYPMIGRPGPDCREALRHDSSERERSRAAHGGRQRATIRSVFVVGPDKKIKLMLHVRDVAHRPQLRRGAARARLDAAHREAQGPPRRLNWKQGEDVIIVPSVSNEEAKEKFPGVEVAEALPDVPQPK